MVAEMIPTNDEARRRLAIDKMVAQMKATAVVQARQMVAEVKAAAKEVEDEFTEFMLGRTDQTIELNDGTKVTLVEADRRTMDATVLEEITTAALYRMATERKIVHKKFDALVETGKFGPVLVDAVVKATPYTKITIN